MNGQSETAVSQLRNKAYPAYFPLMPAPRINLFRANEKGSVGKESHHINAEQIRKLESPNFYAMVYKSAAIDFFELPVGGNGHMDVRYYAWISNNPTSFQLQEIVRSNYLIHGRPLVQNGNAKI